jgi:tRNA (guanine37-N1)-methyltransferase
MEKKRQSLKESLKRSGKFTEEQLRYLPRSFDVLGEIALVQIPFNLQEMKKIIAENLMALNKNVKTVYGKGKFYGRLRKQRIEFLAGKKQEETIYKENNCIFKLNVKTCFFSPRLSTDRMDLAKQVKKKEEVFVMFSGISPYGIVIAKTSRCKKVVCVELSKQCTKYAKESIKLNKLHNIEAIQGDIKRICPKFKKENQKFDRIIMARPQLEETFLKEALMVAKKGSIIHFQDFVKVDELKNKISEKRILDAVKKAKLKVRIIDTRILRELAPYKYHVRVDFKII